MRNFTHPWNHHRKQGIEHFLYPRKFPLTLCSTRPAHLLNVTVVSVRHFESFIYNICSFALLLLFSLFLTFIHVACVKSLFLFGTALCERATICFSVHLPMDIWVASNSCDRRQSWVHSHTPIFFPETSFIKCREPFEQEGRVAMFCSCSTLFHFLSIVAVPSPKIDLISV